MIDVDHAVRQFAAHYGILVRNDSGDEIPPFAVMRRTGTTRVNGRKVVLVDQPDSTIKRAYLVNSPLKIREDGYGWSATLKESGGLVLVSSNPTLDDIYGAQNGSWELAEDPLGSFLMEGTVMTLDSGATVASALQITPARQTMLPYTLTADLDSGSSANATIDGGTKTLTDQYDHIPAGTYLASGTAGWAIYEDGVYTIVTGNTCPITA